MKNWFQKHKITIRIISVVFMITGATLYFFVEKQGLWATISGFMIGFSLGVFLITFTRNKE